MGHIGNGRSYAAEMGAAPNLDAVSDFQALVTEYYSAASVATDCSGRKGCVSSAKRHLSNRVLDTPARYLQCRVGAATVENKGIQH